MTTTGAFSNELAVEEILKGIKDAMDIRERYSIKDFVIFMSKATWEQLGTPANLYGHKIVVILDADECEVYVVQEKDLFPKA